MVKGNLALEVLDSIGVSIAPSPSFASDVPKNDILLVIMAMSCPLLFGCDLRSASKGDSRLRWVRVRRVQP